MEEVTDPTVIAFSKDENLCHVFQDAFGYIDFGNPDAVSSATQNLHTILRTTVA